jgi:uncharacterized damage-inducible protein DinB
MNLVEEAIVMWERYRAGVVAELDNIPEDQWDQAPAEGARTLRQLAQHILESGVGFSHELARPDGNFTRMFDKAGQAALMSAYPPPSNKTEMIALLKRAGADDAARLRAAGDALLTRTMPFMGAPVSTLTTLGFASGHEMYHRGQIATYARSMGCVPVLTRQIEAMQQRR